MRRRVARHLVFAVALAVATPMVLVGPAAASTPQADPPPTFCTAFGEYYDVAFLVQFVTAFAQSLAPKSVTKTRDNFLLVLSPKLQKLLTQMATTASKPLRPAFKREAAKFARGVQTLRSAGLTPAQITALADAQLHATSASQDLVGKAKISKKKLQTALAQFTKIGASVDPSKTFTAAQRTRLGSDGAACGVFPDPSVSCDALVSAADIAAAGGSSVAPQQAQGCWWKGGAAPDGNVYGLGVDVDRGTLAYDRLVSAGTNPTPVPGVGDAATLLDGFASFSDFSSCGHTLVTKSGDHTVTVAMCPATGDASAARLTAIAQGVFAKL